MKYQKIIVKWQNSVYLKIKTLERKALRRMSMKCPKCGKEMELLFVNYKCYHCNPPQGKQMTLDLDIKPFKKSDEGILGEETGWEGYAD